MENLNFLREIQMREDEIKLKFNAVTDMYKMMEAYNVRVPDEEFALYQTLAPTHAQLGEAISTAIANKEASIHYFILSSFYPSTPHAQFGNHLKILHLSFH